LKRGITNRAMKIKKLNRISYIVLKNEVRYGHLKWSISQVAKEAKVSRSWIYKYHGSRKPEILINALRNTLEDFFLLSEERQEILRTKGLGAAFMKSREISQLYPEIYVFYFKHFHADNVYGKLIRKIENDYFDNHLMKRHQFLNRFQGSLLRCMTHGLGLAFYLDTPHTQAMIDFVLSSEFKDWVRSIPNHFDVATRSDQR